jgi:hypothetical protein
MAIQIIDGFQVNTALPIDNRIVASGSAARNAIPYKYEGLRVFDTFDSVPYVYVNGAWQSENAAGISGAGNASYIPAYTSSNVIGNSIIYQSGSNIGISTTAPTAKVDVNGTVKATAITTANGSGIAGILGSNINNGTIEVEGSNSKIINGSTGQVLISGVTNTRWLNQNLLVSGTASSSIFSVINNTSTNAVHYLAFVSSGAWTSTPAATSSIRSNSSDLSYNPSTKILTATRINYSGGTLPGTAASKLTFANLASTTGLNTSNLEFNNVRTSAGTDWLTTAYRIQSRVDDQYLGYIQFNGNNETGISFGTGYQSTDASSNTNERMRLDNIGRVLMNTTTSISTGAILQLRSGNAGSGKYDGIAHRSFTGLDSNWIFEFQNAAGTNRGQITGNGSGGVLYQTSSDRRLKTNIQEMPSMYDKIKNLKPSKFNWKIDNKEDYGFIAQEVYNLIPSLRGEISEAYCDINADNFDFENPLKKDGSDFHYSLDYGRLTPYLTKALQETIEKLETLTDKIKSANTLDELKSSL